MELFSFFVFIFLVFLSVSANGPFFVATGIRFEHSLPFSCTALVLFIYIFGLFNRLYFGAAAATVVLCILFTLGFFLLIKRCRKDGNATPLKNLFTPAFFLFGATVLIIAYINYHRLAYVSDELNHWADTVKAMYIHGVFGTEKITDTFYPEYPPGMSIFQFFFQFLYSQSIEPVFREDILFVAHATYVCSFLFPFFSQLNAKKPLSSLLRIISIFICPLIFFNIYATLYIDGALGILFGCGLARIFTDKEKDIAYYLYVFSAIASLILFKSSGLLLALFLCAAFFIDLVLQRVSRSKKLCFCSFAVALIAFLKLSWDTKVSLGGCKSAFTFSPDLVTVSSIFLQNEKTYRQQVFNEFWPTLFSIKTNSGVGEISEFLFFVIMLVLLFIMGKQAVKTGRLSEAQLRTVLILLPVCLAIYCFGLCFAYVFSFTQEEALVYASLGRYMISIYLAFWVLTVLFAAWLLEDFSEKWQKNILPTTVLLVTLVFCNLPENAKAYLYREEVALSHAFRVRTAQLEAVLAQDRTQSKIYMVTTSIEQVAPSGYDPTLLHYVSRPHQVTLLRSSDTRAPLMSKEEWSRLLWEEYDYVVVFIGDEIFLDEHGDLFEEAFIQGTTAVLYKVDKEMFKLIRLTDIQT